MIDDETQERADEKGGYQQKAIFDRFKNDKEEKARVRSK